LPYLSLPDRWKGKDGSDGQDYADLIGPITANDKGLLCEVGITRRSALPKKVNDVCS
jgi:hypothetical protein